MTTFEVDADYVSQFDVKQVGGVVHQELWIPAEQLDVFNAVGVIRVVRSFQ